MRAYNCCLPVWRPELAMERIPRASCLRLSWNSCAPQALISQPTLDARPLSEPATHILDGTSPGALAALPCACRIATLDLVVPVSGRCLPEVQRAHHESRDESVKYGAIVSTPLAQGEEVVGCPGDLHRDMVCITPMKLLALMAPTKSQ